MCGIESLMWPMEASFGKLMKIDLEELPLFGNHIESYRRFFMIETNRRRKVIFMFSLSVIGYLMQ